LISLNDLKDIEFASANKEEIQSWLFSRFKEITGRTLSRADPIRLFILFVAEVFIRLINIINYTGKQNLLKYAVNGHLDHIGAIVDVDRLPATAATTTCKITLSAVRDMETVIDAGTRISTDSGIYFATNQDLVIKAGELTGEVQATCLSVGDEGNDYMPGEINVIVDRAPYVESIINTTKSGGGSDIEADDEYRNRIHEAPESFSVAGPEGAYKFHTKSVNSSIVDVGVDSPSPGTVAIYPLLDGGKLPSDETLKTVREYLNSDRIRPLTDKLQVSKPIEISYNVNATYYLNKDADASTVKANVNIAVNDFVTWQKAVLGRDINPSRLISMIMQVPGVKRVDVTLPVFTVVNDNTSVAIAKTINVVMGGSEDE